MLHKLKFLVNNENIEWKTNIIILNKKTHLPMSLMDLDLEIFSFFLKQAGT